MPVTKAEVQAEKDRLKAIDSRPIKKIVEAKVRIPSANRTRMPSANNSQPLQAGCWCSSSTSS
eukprot:351197-Chlamydomonas_euryale.AAC.3